MGGVIEGAGVTGGVKTGVAGVMDAAGVTGGVKVGVMRVIGGVVGGVEKEDIVGAAVTGGLKEDAGDAIDAIEECCSRRSEGWSCWSHRRDIEGGGNTEDTKGLGEERRND